MRGYYSVFDPDSKKIADCGSERDALFLIHSRNKTWDGHYYTFNPLPGDIIDVNQSRQLQPYVPVVSIANDIVVNMDGGVGGSWKEISLPENSQEPFIPDFHD
jgi:hypothetical protein